MRSKRTKACAITQNTRENVKERDAYSCIFCSMRYRMSDEAGQVGPEIMHYIPRSQGGLGIERNLAVGCKYHHMMFDNGNQGNREEMKELFKTYLSSRYPGWNEDELVYKKWGN